MTIRAQCRRGMSFMLLVSTQYRQDLYLISSPTFEEAVIHLENGRDLSIKAKKASDKNIYVQSVKLNGEPLDACSFKHTDIANGGTLEFVMGSETV